MSRKQEIINQAKQKLNGSGFAIKSKLIDIEGNGKETTVTCLVWKSINGIDCFISVEFLDYIGIK